MDEKEVIMDEDSLLCLLRDKQLGVLSADLEKLNIFELVGLTNQEIKHSNFLSEVLDPRSRLGLGSSVLKALVRDSLSSINEEQRDENNFDPFHIELGGMDTVEVYRELYNIDLLIVDHEKKFLIVIENKVKASESKGQLKKYRDLIKSRDDYKKFKKLFIFLTPEGSEPDGDSSWISVSYRTIYDSVREQLLTKRLGQASKLILTHYCDLLESRVMNQERLEKIAREIYREHHKALDFIFESRADNIGVLSEKMEEIILNSEYARNSLTKIRSSKSMLRFRTAAMEKLSEKLPEIVGWDRENVMAWELVIRKDYIKCKVVLGPTNDQLSRQVVRDVFNDEFGGKSVSEKWSTLKTWTLHKSKNNDSDVDLDEVAKKATEKFKDVFKKSESSVDKCIERAITKLDNQ
jgi:hypothetical protein